MARLQTYNGHLVRQVVRLSGVLPSANHLAQYRLNIVAYSSEEYDESATGQRTILHVTVQALLLHRQPHFPTANVQAYSCTPETSTIMLPTGALLVEYLT